MPPVPIISRWSKSPALKEPGSKRLQRGASEVFPPRNRTSATTSPRGIGPRASTKAMPAPAEQGGIDSDISLVCELAEKIDLAEISTFAYKIRSVRNIQERIRALADHTAVVEALKSVR
ncbi:unnamed protein product, partial [Iphiclides podalirius]